MIIEYSPAAEDDLYNITEYTASEFYNESAGINIVQQIIKNCSNLKLNPMLGVALADKINFNTDLRFLITGYHLAFYRVDMDRIKIIRILDSRTNYLEELFD